jgi:hypothetical protein
MITLSKATSRLGSSSLILSNWLIAKVAKCIASETRYGYGSEIFVSSVKSLATFLICFAATFPCGMVLTVSKLLKARRKKAGIPRSPLSQRETASFLTPRASASSAWVNHRLFRHAFNSSFVMTPIVIQWIIIVKEFLMRPGFRARASTPPWSTPNLLFLPYPGGQF